ncbi:MAG: hypothetical protein HY433_03805 [Candidatus Liptonbacteria bacterium]|nr:hypothetical protein [Candidatus Liptonbacteria bacterium]
MNQNLLSANIIEELGIGSLPDDKKATLLASMIDLVQKRITLRLIEGLSEGELGEFEKISDSKNPDALSQFAAKHGKNFEEITKEEIVKLKGEMIARANKIS